MKAGSKLWKRSSSTLHHHQEPSPWHCWVPVEEPKITAMMVTCTQVRPMLGPRTGMIGCWFIFDYCCYKATATKLLPRLDTPRGSNHKFGHSQRVFVTGSSISCRDDVRVKVGVFRLCSAGPSTAGLLPPVRTGSTTEYRNVRLIVSPKNNRQTEHLFRNWVLDVRTSE